MTIWTITTITLIAAGALVSACADISATSPTAPTVTADVRVTPTTVTDPLLEHPKPAPDPKPTIVPDEPAPTELEKPKRYTCADRDKMIADFIATHPTLPIVKRLPSGERVYISDRYPAPGSVIHYDGPVCEGGA